MKIEDKNGRKTIIIKAFEDSHSGISIEINKGKKTFYVSGWYDTFGGIQGDEIKLEDFLKLFEKK